MLIAKVSNHRSNSVVEYPVKFLLYINCTGDCSDRAEWHNVVNVVDESNAGVDLGNLVVMEPKLIGASQLLVYEGVPLADVL